MSDVVDSWLVGTLKMTHGFNDRQIKELWDISADFAAKTGGTQREVLVLIERVMRPTQREMDLSEVTDRLKSVFKNIENTFEIKKQKKKQRGEPDKTKRKAWRDRMWRKQ